MSAGYCGYNAEFIYGCDAGIGRCPRHFEIVRALRQNRIGKLCDVVDFELKRSFADVDLLGYKELVIQNDSEDYNDNGRDQDTDQESGFS